jgi:hypothetical protein
VRSSPRARSPGALLDPDRCGRSGSHDGGSGSTTCRRHVRDRTVGALDRKPQCPHVPHVRQHVRVDAPEHSRLEIRIYRNQTAVRIHEALNHVDGPLEERHCRVSVERGALRVQRRSHLLRRPFGSWHSRGQSADAAVPHLGGIRADGDGRGMAVCAAVDERHCVLLLGGVAQVYRASDLHRHERVGTEAPRASSARTGGLPVLPARCWCFAQASAGLSSPRIRRWPAWSGRSSYRLRASSTHRTAPR